MGYTHYYKGWLTLSDSLVADIKKIISTSDVSIKGGLGTGEAIVNNEKIVLNGDAEKDEDYETFSLENGVNHSNFCKTAQMPYDEVVGAILLRAAHYSNKFKVSSDGRWGNEDWSAPKSLYRETFGEMPTRPEEIRE